MIKERGGESEDLMCELGEHFKKEKNFHRSIGEMVLHAHIHFRVLQTAK